MTFAVVAVVVGWAYTAHFSPAARARVLDLNRTDTWVNCVLQDASEPSRTAGLPSQEPASMHGSSTATWMCCQLAGASQVGAPDSLDMDQRKQERVDRERVAAEERRRKTVVSLSVCFVRSEVMREHHDAIVLEAVAAGGTAVFAQSEVKQARFVTYISYWFAALSALIERYQALVTSKTIPGDEQIDALLRPEMIDLIKPFRNAVAHCSEHDDPRVLDLLSNPHTVPDWAAEVATVFRGYFDRFRDSTNPK